MERITHEAGNTALIPECALTQSAGGYTGAAADKLAAYETLQENILRQQDEYAAELAKLRNEGKKNSVKFRELLGKKLMNSHMLTMFQLHGLG